MTESWSKWSGDEKWEKLCKRDVPSGVLAEASRYYSKHHWGIATFHYVYMFWQEKYSNPAAK